MRDIRTPELKDLFAAAVANANSNMTSSTGVGTSSDDNLSQTATGIDSGDEIVLNVTRKSWSVGTSTTYDRYASVASRSTSTSPPTITASVGTNTAISTRTSSDIDSEDDVQWILGWSNYDNSKMETIREFI
jgi:hypothetical protein